MRDGTGCSEGLKEKKDSMTCPKGICNIFFTNIYDSDINFTGKTEILAQNVLKYDQFLFQNTRKKAVLRTSRALVKGYYSSISFFKFPLEDILFF